MLVSLDQVNTLAKSRYKNYMITIQSVNSMMMEEIANNAGTTDDVDFLHTSAKDVDTIEQYFTFIAVKVIDIEVEKVMLELRLTLAKEDKINNKIKGKDKLVSVCKQLSEPLAKKAEELCKTKFYKNSHFEVGSRIAFIDELQIYNSNFINYLVFVLDNLNIILRENLGINLRIATLAKEDTHCPFDKNINNVLNSLLAFSDDDFSEQVKHIRVFEPLDTCLRKSETISDFIKQQEVKQGNNARLGFWCSFGIEERALARSLYEQYKEEIKNVDKILVLGTEEFMSVPIYFAREIESHQKEVVCHSTARSPIGVNNTLAKYPITKGYKLPSFYDVERLSYLYHMEHYDLIFILTDSKSIPKETIKAMSYLMSIYKNYNTQLIQFK